MSVELVQSWWYRDPHSRNYFTNVTIPSGYSDTFFLGIAAGNNTRICENMNLGVIGDLKAFTRYTPSPYYMDSFCRMFGLVYPGASGRTLNWNSVWYADDSIGVAALFMFSGVNQTTPVGTPEEEGATNNDPTVQIEAAIGDLCLTGFGRRLENPETLTLGTDQTSLFDEVSLAGVGTYNWRLKIISRLAVSENQSITVMSDQVNESATMGIAVKPTVYDSILVNPQPFLFM